MQFFPPREDFAQKVKTMAEFKEAWFHRLKAAQRDLIKTCGGIERCAEITSMSKSQVGRWNNAVDGDLMPLNAVYLLEAECNVLLVTAALAALNNRRLADPDKVEKQNSDIMTGFSETVQHASELMNAGASAFADGKVTPTEAIAMDRAASVLEAKTAQLRNALAAAKVGTLKVFDGEKK